MNSIIEDSFAPIFAYGPNAAIMHYKSKEEDCLPIYPKGLYLIDSGGQYMGGTTDIITCKLLHLVNLLMRREIHFSVNLVVKSVINHLVPNFLYS